MTEDTAKRIRRERRENKHRNFYRHVISDPGKLVGGEQETIMVRIYEHSFRFDPFPASQADLVIVGTVTSAQGFVSTDGTYVYSDFHVTIDEILKNDSSARLATGSEIIASRFGASVDFPSGHTRQFVIEKQGLPKVGSRYVLFLQKAEPDLSEYEIIVSGAYEISAQKAYPLDDYQPELDGAPISTLMSRVKTAIGAIKQ